MEIMDILLAEDNMDDAGLTIRALKKHNLANRVHHVRDGNEALVYLTSLTPANYPKLILLDLKMPKVDGIEVLKKIKMHESMKLVPVVMLTSSKEESDVVESYRLGANAYIVKPVDFQHFMKVVADLGFFWLLTNEPIPK